MTVRPGLPAPPGPRGSFLFGNLKEYEAERLGFLESLAEQHGPIARLDRATTLVSGVDLVKQVLSDPGDRFLVPRNVLLEPIPLSARSDWRRARRLLNPPLRPEAVAMRIPELRERLRYWIGEAPPGESDSVSTWSRIVGLACAEFLVGPAAPTLWPAMNRMMDALAPLVGNVLPAPSFLPTPSRRELRRAFGALEQRVKAIVDGGRSLDERASGASEWMMGAAERSTHGNTASHVARLLVGALLASHTIPAATICWTLLLLAQHPHWSARVREEAALAERVHDRWNVPTSGVAGAVVREALRLYPPTWLMSRKVAEESEVGGFRLRANTTILMSPYVIQRQEQNFPDPHAFRPERWLEGPGSRAFLSFGTGPRGCPGSSLGMTVATLAIVLVHSEFDYRVTAGLPPVLNTRFSLIPEGMAGEFC